jgi:hypothetical protein
MQVFQRIFSEFLYGLEPAGGKWNQQEVFLFDGYLIMQVIQANL